MRLKLATVLRGIVSQSLVPRASGEGRVCIQEVLVNTPFISELIKKGDVAKIDDAIRDGATTHGMMTKNQSLFRAWESGQIGEGDAVSYSNRPTDLDIQIRTAKFERRRADAAAAAPPPKPAPVAPPEPNPAEAFEPKPRSRWGFKR